MRATKRLWLRVPGHIVFAAGGLFLAAYALKLVQQLRGVSLGPIVAVQAGLSSAGPA